MAKERPGVGESKRLPPPAGTTKPAAALMSVSSLWRNEDTPRRLDPPALGLIRATAPPQRIRDRARRSGRFPPSLAQGCTLRDNPERTGTRGAGRRWEA